MFEFDRQYRPDNLPLYYPLNLKYIPASSVDYQYQLPITNYQLPITNYQLPVP
ncbi:MAG: hypothetical protein HC894_08225, partial [Microcoleus sp. SM1_3_4]|nr:hypothetical protein [Microcoleus sp. SM1_3_4]